MATQAMRLDFLKQAEHGFEGLRGSLTREDCGADEAVQAVADLHQVFCAGLNSPGRQVGNLLFPGPIGAGKTRVVEATEYGARHLKRAIERHVVYPLAILLVTEQVRLSDVISIDWDGVEAKLKFSKPGEGAAVPAALPLRKTTSEVLAASCGAPGIVSPQTASVQSTGWYLGCGVRRHESSKH
jgi:hypothetical protein